MQGIRPEKYPTFSFHKVIKRKNRTLKGPCKFSLERQSISSTLQ